MDSTGLSAQGLMGCSKGIDGLHSHLEARLGNPSSKPTHVVGRIQVLVVVGLRFPISLLDVTQGPVFVLRGHSFFSHAFHVVLSCFDSPTSPSAFKGLI